MQFTENTVVVDELEDDEGAELLDELVDVLLDDVELSSEPTKVVVGLIEEFVVVFGFGPSNA